MPLLDPYIDEDFSSVRRAANDVMLYSYRWFSDHPHDFANIEDFLSYFDSIEEKLDRGCLAYEIFSEISELAIASRISTFANEVHNIQSRYIASVEALVDPSVGWASSASQVPPESDKEIRALFINWRNRFSALRDQTIEQLRTLPSIADEEIVDQEVRAFDLSLRLADQSQETQRLRASRPVVQCSAITVSPGGSFNLTVDDFQMFKGEIVSCVGPNGSGKSTFLRLLSGQLLPTQGQISYPFIDSVFGDQGKKASWPARRRRVAFVEQEPTLSEMRVDKRIALNLATSGVLGESNRALTHLFMERFRLFGKTQKSQSQLSSGQRKLAAMACALSMAPDLIILDEPLSSLDYMATMHFLDDIRRVAKGGLWGRPAIIFSTHHLDEPNWLADRLFLFSDGKIRQFSAGEIGNLFEIVVRGTVDSAAVSRLFAEKGLEILAVSGRMFVKSIAPKALADVAVTLEQSNMPLTSINDITRSPKRCYLGI